MFFGLATYVRFKILKKKYSEKINDLEDISYKHSVRSIMSRQEIVFSNKIEKEVEVFVDLNNQSRKHTLKAERYEYVANTTLEVTGPVISFLFTAYILWQNIQGNTLSLINVTSLIFLIYFASRFVDLMYHTSWILTQALEYLAQIEKFSKFLDETKNLEKYENGEDFV